VTPFRSPVRHALVFFALVIVGLPLRGQAPSLTAHVGVAQAEWLSRGEWATAIAVDYRPMRRGVWALVVGGHGLFNQFTPGSGLTRRQTVVTASAGAELRAYQGNIVRAYLSSAVAGSYWWYRYRPLQAGLPAGSGFDEFGLVNGLRLEAVNKRGPALSLRADVRTSFSGSVRWSPQLGVGLAF
jgi:hypothetical protein